MITDEHVNERILNVLYKVFLLTMFYEIMVFGGTIIAFLLGIQALFGVAPHLNYSLTLGKIIFFCVISLTVSFAMFLMMDHSEDKYYKFLRWIMVTKIE